MTLFGIVLGAPVLVAIGVVIGWHIPTPPWARWFFKLIGWKTAA